MVRLRVAVCDNLRGCLRQLHCLHHLHPADSIHHLAIAEASAMCTRPTCNPAGRNQSKPSRAMLIRVNSQTPHHRRVRLARVDDDEGVLEAACVDAGRQLVWRRGRPGSVGRRLEWGGWTNAVSGQGTVGHGKQPIGAWAMASLSLRSRGDGLVTPTKLRRPQTKLKCRFKHHARNQRTIPIRVHARRRVWLQACLPTRRASSGHHEKLAPPNP